MPVSQDYDLLDPATITIDRDDRQRRELDISSMIESVKKRGVLHPIIIDRNKKLIAGERRLTACLKLGVSVPVRYFDSLSPEEALAIELEENIKREDLFWKDEVKAIVRIHNLFKQINDKEWSQEKTAEELGYSTAHITRALRVDEDFNDPRIDSCVTVTAAYNILVRQDERKKDNMLSKIIEAGRTQSISKAEPIGESEQTGIILPLASPPPLQDSILCADFIEWVANYRGPLFNFIHCDFPYGIKAFAGQQMARVGDFYDDDPDVYWALLEAFATHRDNFISHSAHVMFWFSMQKYTETVRFFKSNMPEFEVNPTPVIWVKSDNSGICPDPKKYQRQVYESALLLTRGGRPLVKVVSNVYSGPTDKTLHTSTKPEPMLKYFFGALVDQHTHLLDPTCGSGSALRAAEDAGAEFVFGLDQNTEHVANANAALRKARALSKLHDKVFST